MYEPFMHRARAAVERLSAPRSRPIGYALAAGLTLALGACGGGNSSSFSALPSGGVTAPASTVPPATPETPAAPAPSVPTYTVGGTVAGLTGHGLVLENNASDSLPVSADGAFTFATPVTRGTAYKVTVATQPTDQVCTVANDQGSASADVKDVQVICQTPVVQAPASAPANLSVSYSAKSYNFSWSPVVGATYYQVLEDLDGTGPGAPSPIGGHVAVPAFNYAVTLYRSVNATYAVLACNAAGCSASSPTLTPDVVKAIGYFKASNPQPYGQLGIALAISGDGKTLAAGAPGEGSNATGINGNQADTSSSSAGAVYVFALNGGTWVQQAYVKASNTDTGDFFGYSLALSSDGSSLAVGAPFEASNASGIDGNQADNSIQYAGAVYVFNRAGTTWTQGAYIKASNNGGDYFGYSVALSGDGQRLAVGAHVESSSATGVNGNQADSSAPGAGAVYVFNRTAGAWAQDAFVKASNTDAADYFGRALALSLDGNTLAVGAPYERSSATGINGDQANNSQGEAGAAYVFSRAGGTWAQQAYVKASNSAAGLFGWFLALSADGSTLAVSAIMEGATGAVYVYTRSGTTWSHQAYVKPLNPTTSGQFGFSVALSADGNTLAAGARHEASNAIGLDGNQTDLSAPTAGAAYLFRRSAGSWSQTTYIKASNTDRGDQFGQTLALASDGGTLAVGATLERSSATGVGGNQADNSIQASGAVYLY